MNLALVAYLLVFYGLGWVMVLRSEQVAERYLNGLERLRNSVYDRTSGPGVFRLMGGWWLLLVTTRLIAMMIGLWWGHLPPVAYAAVTVVLIIWTLGIAGLLIDPAGSVRKTEPESRRRLEQYAWLRTLTRVMYGGFWMLASGLLLGLWY